MMLPSGIATLLCLNLPVQPALAVTCVHAGTLQFSSPKNHAQPVGVFNDESVNDTESGAVPETGLAVKLAIGTAA
jgi:hypothetical protein